MLTRIYRPFYNIKYGSGDWDLVTPPLPKSPYRFALQNLRPFQVFSCWNGVTVLSAALFEHPHSLRFRSVNGTDRQSECYLFCSDIWKERSAIGVDGRVKPGRRVADERGGRIQVVPRASVGYELVEYEMARQDRNTTAFETDGAERNQLLLDETVAWEQWPPRLINSYPDGESVLRSPRTFLL